MNCEEAELLIEEFYDCEVNYGVRKSLETHAINCPRCKTSIEVLRRLDNILEKLPVPAPSDILDQRIMQSLKHKQASLNKENSRWYQIFFGSIAIPKPILAASMVLAAVAVIASHSLGRNYAVSENIPNNSSALLTDVSQKTEVSPTSKIIEIPVIKIIEKPVVKEKIVNRFVPANRRKSIEKGQNVFTEGDSTLNNSIVKAGYPKHATLKGFQPLPEIKTKIIREQVYEK